MSYIWLQHYVSFEADQNFFTAWTENRERQSPVLPVAHGENRRGR